MVGVFKTNVQEGVHAESLTDLLLAHFPGSRVNFDLEDCDRVLRVEGADVAEQVIAAMVSAQGFLCEELK